MSARPPACHIASGGISYNTQLSSTDRDGHDRLVCYDRASSSPPPPPPPVCHPPEAVMDPATTEAAARTQIRAPLVSATAGCWRDSELPMTGNLVCGIHDQGSRFGYRNNMVDVCSYPNEYALQPADHRIHQASPRNRPPPPPNQSRLPPPPPSHSIIGRRSSDCPPGRDSWRFFVGIDELRVRCRSTYRNSRSMRSSWARRVRSMWPSTRPRISNTMSVALESILRQTRRWRLVYANEASMQSGRRL